MIGLHLIEFLAIRVLLQESPKQYRLLSTAIGLLSERKDPTDADTTLWTIEIEEIKLVLIWKLDDWGLPAMLLKTDMQTAKEKITKST